jgi:hypothetical protein
MKARGLQTRPAIGTRVRFTGYFLKCTGQVSGPEGLARFTIVACTCGLCASDRFVAVDEPAFDPDPDQSPHRHIALGNLQIIGAPLKACDQPEEWNQKLGGLNA